MIDITLPQMASLPTWWSEVEYQVPQKRSADAKHAPLQTSGQASSASSAQWMKIVSIAYSFVQQNLLWALRQSYYCCDQADAKHALTPPASEICFRYSVAEVGVIKLMPDVLSLLDPHQKLASEVLRVALE